MKSRFALALAGVALISLPALAQTTTPPAARQAPSTTAQHGLKPGEWRATKLVGLNVYDPQNNKIGDIKQLIVDKEGTVQSVVISAGGFLGMGEHDVAVPFKQIKWSDTPATSGTSTSATMPKTNATGNEANRGYPDHAVLDMTKDQIKALPTVDL